MLGCGKEGDWEWGRPKGLVLRNERKVVKDWVVAVVELLVAMGVGSAAVYKSFLPNFLHPILKPKHWERAGV